MLLKAVSKSAARNALFYRTIRWTKMQFFLKAQTTLRVLRADKIQEWITIVKVWFIWEPRNVWQTWHTDIPMSIIIQEKSR